MFKKSYNLDAKVRALEEENRELREASENHGGTEIAKVPGAKATEKVGLGGRVENNDEVEEAAKQPQPSAKYRI